MGFNTLFSSMYKLKILISWLGILLLVVIFSLVYIDSKREMELINKKGNVTRGCVYFIKKNKHGYWIKYTYQIDKKIYKSQSSMSKGLVLGDSIYIKYYIDNPEINRASIEVPE